MKFWEALDIRPGVTAVIGSGGKSTLLKVLAEELKPATVILCTTTHMFPPEGFATLTDGDERALAETLAMQRVACVGTLGVDGRLRASDIPIRRLAGLAKYVLVEADGSRTLPLKAHTNQEPAVPEEAGEVICVAGLSGLGKPIREVVHRAELYARLAGVSQDEIVTPAVMAAVLNAEGLGDRYYLNQADGEEDVTRAWAVAALLRRSTACGSLHQGTIECL